LVIKHAIQIPSFLSPNIGTTDVNTPLLARSLTQHTHSFVGGMILGLVLGLNQDLAVKAGLRAAYLSVLSRSPVSKILTPDLFTEQSLRMWAPWSAMML